MSLESLIKMQSSGTRSIEEPNTPRPGGVPQGSVLVILDVTKDAGSAPVYWALGNVVRRGDNIKIVGIVTHVCNPMGFKTRVDKNSWIGSNGLLLQHEITTKRAALDNIPHVKEWCEKAGVKLEIDVKAGYATKFIIVDEAKAIGAYHVVLDKNMKSDRKYFIEHLTCFVSRARQSGGVETIRSFSVTKQLPPLVPTPPNTRLNGTIHSISLPTPSSGSTVSMTSLGSNFSHRGSASSNSFGVVSSDGFLTQDSDAFSGAPTTGESFNDRHQEIQEMSFRPPRGPHSEVGSLRATYSESGSQKGNSIPSTPRGESDSGYNLINRKPALRKWLAEEETRGEVPSSDNPNESSFADRTNNNGNKNSSPNEPQQQVVKRISPHLSPHLSPHMSPHVSPPVTLEKFATVAAPLPLPPSHSSHSSQSSHSSHSSHSSPGRAFASVRTLPSPIARISPPMSRMPSPPCSKLSQSLHKTVWIWTRSKEVMRSAVEVGWTTFVFTPDTKYMAPQWTSIEWIKPLFLEGGRFLNQESKPVALLGQVYSGEQLDYLPAMMGGTDIVVINDLDWQVIPPEDIVAAFQGRRTQLFATANSAADCQVYLEALEVGTDGVVLHTENVAEIIALRDYLTAKKGEKALAIADPPMKEVGELKLVLVEPTSMARSEANSDRVASSPRLHRLGSSPRSDVDPLTQKAEANPLHRIGSSPRLVESPRHSGHFQTQQESSQQASRLVNATVKSIVSVGEGDRVSVDLCNLLNPGEALLVGSFSKGMFLVHSEVQDNITSRRSFRVNAGPVHAYTGMAGGRITYLSELESGGHVLAVDAHGNHRTVLVGRVSIETKPLVLVQVEAEGESFSVMLQDADSVRLVVPADKQRPGCEAIAVTKLQPGDTVLLSMEDDDCSCEQ